MPPKSASSSSRTGCSTSPGRVGDHQLSRFRSDPGSRGKVLDTGLWRCARRPNHFADAGAWWGISIVAFSAWPGVLRVLSPLPPRKERHRVRTLPEHSTAPDFELPDQDGKLVGLSSLLLDGPIVLFFYPAAMTPGCTKESCHFRDLGAEFAALGAHRVGISADPVGRQLQFADAHGLDYPLLSDEDGPVAAAYGVRRRMLVPVKRATFVIDTDRVVRKVIASELRMEVHADEALAALRRL